MVAPIAIVVRAGALLPQRDRPETYTTLSGTRQALQPKIGSSQHWQPINWPGFSLGWFRFENVIPSRAT